MFAPQLSFTARRWLPVAAAALGTVIATTGVPSDPAAASSGVNQNAAAWCGGSSMRVGNTGTGSSGGSAFMVTPGIAARPVCDPYTRDSGARSARELASAVLVAAITPPVVLPQLPALMAPATTSRQPQLPAGPQPSGQSTTTYSVRVGDCLSDIATSHNIPDWKQLYEVNRRGISNPDLIYPGQLLRLPSTQTSR
ncbi:MAG TPA: LysM peptidoglycan-binding domain-containing protein [Pseudonocardiaceae bacterium]|jgi:nucleoid-associated protein YgaU|nr:LysM peptidoglycan-binding domain-containing protein [Pseudonocardiaceae bacterium]